MSQVSYGTITITDVASSGDTNQHFWFNPTQQGTLLAGAYITDTNIDTFKNSKTGGYILARSNGIEFGRGSYKSIELIAGTQNDSLNFYEPNSNTIDASLTSSGLVLSKGGIKAGTAGQNGFVYLSSENYQLKDATHNGFTINEHTPTAAGTDGKTSDDFAWREIIGTKFGVDSEGNLYASNVDISGEVNATSGTIGGCTIDNEGHLVVPSAYITGTLTADRIVFQSSTVENQLINQQEGLDTLQYAIQINSENASIIMGDESSFHIKIIGDSNNEDYGLGFYYGTTKVSYMSDQRLNIPYSVVLKEMQLSDKWSWTQKESGNMTLVWIGEATS